MKVTVDTVYCSILLRIFLAAGVFNTAAAFTSQHVSQKSLGQGIQPAAKNYRKILTCGSRKSFFKEEYESTHRTSLSQSSSLRAIPRIFGTVEWSDVLYDDTSVAFDAWEWTACMGAPSALIAAAVLVTLSETRLKTAPQPEDKTWIRFTKQMMRFLLMSSFGLEVASIFVGNMTGSMLLGHGPQTSAKKLVGYLSPLQLLRHHHEMEYLFTQISFLQGLIHWLGAVACELAIPFPKETTSAKRMNKCLASWLITLIFSIMAFYNHHINFYSDYAHMIHRFLTLLLLKKRRFRPMQLLGVPSFFVSMYLTWGAFASPAEED